MPVVLPFKHSVLNTLFARKPSYSLVLPREALFTTSFTHLFFRPQFIITALGSLAHSSCPHLPASKSASPVILSPKSLHLPQFAIIYFGDESGAVVVSCLTHWSVSYRRVETASVCSTAVLFPVLGHRTQQAGNSTNAADSS